MQAEREEQIKKANERELAAKERLNELKKDN